MDSSSSNTIDKEILLYKMSYYPEPFIVQQNMT